MGPKYDNERYPDVKPYSIEDYMNDTKIESLSGANFLWGNKTIRN